MKLALIILGAVSLLELGMWLPLMWGSRKVTSGIVVGLLAASTSGLIFVHPRFWTALVAILSVYRIFNLMRVVNGRMQADFLRQTTRRTSQNLVGLQLITVIPTLLNHYIAASNMSRWIVLTSLQLIAGLVFVLSTRRHLRTTKTIGPARAYADKELPTLTVAIPARNETEDLETCLQVLIASDYPKLEILVLDDCSQNKRTPEIIRGFAHDGVRFLAGSESTDSWLAKNYAYHQLAEAASGEYILFCGVDVSFEPNALRTLVSTLLEKDKSMLSVLPHNTIPQDVLTYLVQPARYAWELCLPRRLFNRPPVLSTCWLVKRSFLESTGGFKATSRSVTPESYFARCARVHDGYSFVRSNLVLSSKPFREQRATAIRTRYPQLHRRPELVCLVGIAELSFLVAPFLVFGSALIDHQLLIAGLSGLTCLLVIIFYTAVVTVTYRQFRIWFVLLAPLAAIYDIGLLNFSMWKYEFDEVIWKDRNICLPVMRSFPNLPVLKTIK